MSLYLVTLQQGQVRDPITMHNMVAPVRNTHMYGSHDNINECIGGYH